MLTLLKACALDGGNESTNPLLGYSAPEGSTPAAYWNTTMGNTDGGFDEMFGSFFDHGRLPSGFIVSHERGADGVLYIFLDEIESFICFSSFFG